MRRWMRNHAAANKQLQAQALYWFLLRCCEFITIDVSSTTDWSAVTQAVDGILDGSLPTRFTKPSSNVYVFSAADVGRHIAIRDNTTPTNSGVYTIMSIVGDHTVILNSPVANFTGTSVNVGWSLFDDADLPPNDAWFVIQSQGNVHWQAKITVQETLTPKGVTFELGAFGGWDPTTNAWILPVSGTVHMHEDTVQTFCVADEELGGLFVWAEDALSNRCGVLCSEFAGIHAPQGLGIPADNAHVALLGHSGTDLNTLNRTHTGATNGFATDGYVTLPDKSGYVNAYLHQWKRIADSFDVMSLPLGELDPRSGEGDSFGFVVYQVLPFVHIRGFVPLIRMIHDDHANKTLLNSGAVMAVQSGIGVEWDASIPV